jgi:hypothetical protein
VATLREKIDYLLKSDGILESTVLAKAIDVGVTKLYDDAIAEAYIEETIDRKTAIAALGVEKVSELDYALQSIEKDVAWGIEDFPIHFCGTSWGPH